ncbi:hypothetical protein HWV62_35228 [Athelia sp. TMB]|nr:hypothetical protein HWV62_35228 [Athelia sp. TMB]
MDMYGGSIGSPIVISEDEEDAAFVDQQLQYHDEYDLALTPPRESTSYSEARRASGSSFNTEERQAEDGLVIHQSNSPQSTTVNHWEAEDPVAKKRKRDDPIHPLPAAPQTKKQKKKKAKQKQKPFPQTYSSESNGFGEYGSGYSDTIGQDVSHWTGSSYNTYQVPYNLGPVLANSSLAPLLDQEALFRTHGQFGNLPLDSTFHGGLYNPMLASSYQQPFHTLPSEPSYPPPTHMDENMYSVADSSLSISAPPSAREYDPQESLGPSPFAQDSISPFNSDVPMGILPPSTAPQPIPQPPPAPPPTLPPPPPYPAIPTGPSQAFAALPPTTLPNSQSIGMLVDSDSTSTHGVFQLPPGKRIKPACALVMENVPRIFRTDTFVRNWSQRAAGIVPYYHHINDKGKVLLVFQSPELARKAFDSPRMSHGQGREGIRLWWYREPQEILHKREVKAAPAPRPLPVVMDLEEGEIEEAGSSKVLSKGTLSELGGYDLSIGDPPMSKKARKRIRAAQLQALNTNPPPRAGSWDNYPIGQSIQNVQVKNSTTRKWSPEITRMVNHRGIDSLDRPQASRNASDADADSIASSVAASPNLVAASTSAMDDDIQDMELESPVSTRFDLRDAHLKGVGAVPAMKAIHRSPAEVNPPVVIAQPTPVASHIQTASTFPLAKSVLAHRQTPPTSTPTPPSDTPSEPRAMRMARGPRTLSERTRELEQRLARSKNEMGRPSNHTLSKQPAPASAPAVTAASASLSSLPPPPAHLPARPGSINMAAGPARTSSTAQITVTLPSPPLPAHLPARPISAAGPASTTPAIQAAASVPSSPPPAAVAAATAPPTDQSSDAAEKLSMEENLRRLVLQSRKAKAKTRPLASQAAPLVTAPSQPADTAEPSSTSPLGKLRVSVGSAYANDTPQVASALEPVTSLDDLAVSFINDAIQGGPAPAPTQASVKIDLAAKQRRLEQHISETKRLMAKLTTASSKAERNVIFELLREQSRMMDEDSTTQPRRISPEAERAIPDSAIADYVPRKTSWPETSRDCVVMVSDDEDD